jgi:histone acetyltransferase (RNA polymerase elongator complex component)
MEIYANAPDNRPVQIAFYGGNFLGLSKDTIRSLLTAATRFVAAGRADGIRFSTRPDTIDNERLALIADYPVSIVEIGAQSMSDRVLAQSRRGHLASDTVQAVERLNAFGYQTGVQMMIGLPGDDKKTVLSTGRKIAALTPAFVRIYPTIVLAGSPLGRLYAKGQYHPLDLAAAVDLTRQLLVHFHGCHIPVIRMGLQASTELDTGSSVMAGPYHPAFGHLVYDALFFDAVLAGIGADPSDASIDIFVHSRNISKMRGLNNRNIQQLTDRFHPRRITVGTDDTLDLDRVVVNGHCRWLYGKNSGNAGIGVDLPCA